jgi:hypothetical protein
MRHLIAAAGVGVFAIFVAAPARADCAPDRLHCPVPNLDDLEHQTCYVIDKNAPTFGLANQKLNAAYAMTLKYDLTLDDATTVVAKSIADYCPWDQ